MLRLYARLRGVAPAIREQAIEQLLTRIGLQQYSDRWDQLPGRQNELWIGLCIQWLMHDCLPSWDAHQLRSCCGAASKNAGGGVVMHSVWLLFDFKGALSAVTRHDCDR